MVHGLSRYQPAKIVACFHFDVKVSWMTEQTELLALRMLVVTCRSMETFLPQRQLVCSKAADNKRKQTQHKILLWHLPANDKRVMMCSELVLFLAPRMRSLVCSMITVNAFENVWANKCEAMRWWKESIERGKGHLSRFLLPLQKNGMLTHERDVLLDHAVLWY